MTSTPLTEHKITGAFVMNQTSEAALLLLRDLSPAPEAAPSETPNEASRPAAVAPAPEPALPMFPVLPVADVLITERRICSACGSISEAQSDRVHRLLSSCEGDPYKRVLRPRKPDEHPLDRRVSYTHTVFAEHCACCWQPTQMWGEVVDIRPKRPKPRQFVKTERILTPSGEKREKKELTEFRKRLAEMPLAKALDFL